MKRPCNKCFYLLIVSFIFSTFVFSQNSVQTDSSLIKSSRFESGIILSAQVDKNKVPFNRTLVLLVQLKWYGNLDKYQIHQFDNPILNNLEIIANSSANKVSTENGENIAVHEYSFTLQPQSLGMSYIEGIIIKYTDLDTDTEYSLTTNRIEVKVIDPLPESGNKIWILWLFLLFVLIWVVFVVFSKVKKRRAEQLRKAQEEAEKAIPLEEKYLKEFKTLLDLNDATIDIGKSFSLLSRFLRKFLKEKFNIPAEVTTTEDVMNELNNQKIDERFTKDMKDILTTSDIIKFSGSNVDKSELERIYSLIESSLHKSLRGEIISKNNEQKDNNSID